MRDERAGRNKKAGLPICDLNGDHIRQPGQLCFRNWTIDWRLLQQLESERTLLIRSVPPTHRNKVP